MPQWKILIVDDNPDDRAVCRRRLLHDPHAEYLLQEADSASAGLAVCTTFQPDCILLDYRLPDLDGVQFLTRLAAQMGVQTPAVVMLTGTGSETIVVEAMKHGAQDYLHKGTFTTETLARAITSAIELSTLRRTLEAQRYALAESEERFRAIANYTYDWESWIGPNGRPLWINPAVERLTGWSVSECLAMPEYPLFLIHEDDRARMAKHFHAALGGDSANDVEFRLTTKAGDTVWVAGSWQPIRSQGHWRGYRSSMRDIRARKEAEAERERLLAELQQFSYIVSHDLNEPLRTIGNYVRLLARQMKGKLDDEAEESMAYVTDAAQRMQQMLADLLEYTRAGQTPEFTAVDCEAVLTQVLSSLNAHITERGAEITHDSLPTVWGDAMRLSQVLQNLISNALKFCEAQPPRIHIAAVKENNHYMFSVRDNGIGIEPQQIGRLFQVFQRLHARSEYPGSGIGLAICKRIVEQHGGRIWVESQPRKGSVFYFTISKNKEGRI